MLRTTSIAAISLALATGGVARAQSADSAALFDEGDRLMKQGKIAEACEAFESSNRIEQRAGTLVRLGECREQNHQLASAWVAYKDALTRVKDPRKRDIAQDHAKALEPRLSYVKLVVPDSVRVEGMQIARNGKLIDSGLWNRDSPTDGGQEIYVVRAPGYKEWQTTVTVPEEKGQLTVEVPKLDELPKQPVAPAVETHTADVVAAETEPSMFTPRRKLALGIAGGGVAFAVAGVALGITAKQHESQATALCPDPNAPCAEADHATSLLHSGHQLALAADVGFGLAGAAAITAGVLWYLGAPQPTGAVSVVPTNNGFAVAGAF